MNIKNLLGKLDEKNQEKHMDLRYTYVKSQLDQGIQSQKKLRKAIEEGILMDTIREDNLGFNFTVKLKTGQCAGILYGDSSTQRNKTEYLKVKVDKNKMWHAFPVYYGK